MCDENDPVDVAWAIDQMSGDDWTQSEIGRVLAASEALAQRLRLQLEQ